MKKKLFKREIYLEKLRNFYHDFEMIKVITGIRRCGKSSLMEMIKDELLEEGVSKEQIVFINLDKRGYKSIKTADALDALIEKESPKKKDIYLFIDEIQNVEGFEEVINGFREEGNYSVFITGSNSYLLSGELITKLTGRYLEFELYPLNFTEYRQMKQFYGKEINPNPLVELDQYILEGGFPYTVQYDDFDSKQKYVEEVVKEIFEKDIRRRVKIRNVAEFEKIQRYIMNNFGTTTNIENIYKHFHDVEKSKIRRQTISKYITILENAKLIYRCSRFDMKSKKSLTGEEKYYIADLGLYFSRNVDQRINYGPCLENIVYLYAKSKGYSISVGRIGKLECDFIVRKSKEGYVYIQVSRTIADEAVEDREYRPLEKILDNYPKYILTTDYLLQKRNGIKHMNLIDFIASNREFD